MAIVLMTANRWKIAEYRRFLERHAQPLIVEPPTDSADVIAGWLQTARAVLADESNIFDLAGDLVDSAHVGPARNICRLHAWVRDPVTRAVVRKTYFREVRGEFDATKLRPDDPTVFDWDSAFTSAAGTTLEAMDRAGLKNSAREQCLSAFARATLHHRAPKRLRWTEAETGSWSTDLKLLTVQPLYADLPPPLQSAVSMVVEQGVFFRAAKSRRDGNYWLPGLNGGVPYVPKGDPIHEATYMFHDLMHQLMPDLVFDGGDTLDHKRVYIAYRMMSEGVSLVLADMVFADSLAERPEHAGYDFTKRKILPLYRAIEPARRTDLQWLVRQVCGFVLRGDPGQLPAETDAWRAFATKYSRFFIADFQWTRMNWQSLTSRSAMSRHWIDLVHPSSFRPLGTWFISELVDEIGRGVSVPALCDALFDIVWRRRIESALTHSEEAPDPALAVSAGFRRWLTGQLALFSRYAPIVAVPPLAYELAARIRAPRPFAVDEIATIRQRFGDHVRALARDGVISDDDAAIYPDLFPLFDPFFLRDYDEAQQEFETVAEASAVAFAP